MDFIPNTPRQADIDAALCNCLGFGSKNSALVLGTGAMTPSSTNHSRHRGRRDSDRTQIVSVPLCLCGS